MTQEELYEQRLRELKLAKALYKKAKVDYRKTLLTNISNKLLSPYKKASKEISIVKSRMISEYENKRQGVLLKQIELLEKKDQRLEDALNYIETVKSDVKEFRNNTLESASILFNENLQKSKDTVDVLKRKGVSVVSSASCFMGNVKNSLITSLDKKTTLHRDIESKILDMKLNKASEDYKKALDESKNRKMQEMIEKSIERERSFKDTDTIRARFNKINKNKSYMGTATNRALDYFRGKKSKLDDKLFDARVYVAVLDSKVSSAKSKVAIAFNSQIDKLKTKALDVKEAIDEKIDENKSLNAAKRVDNEIKRAQLEMKRQAINDINNDIFDGAVSLTNNSVKTI